MSSSVTARQAFSAFVAPRQKQTQPQNLQAVDRGNWWWPIVREPFTGAWQKSDRFNYNAPYSRESVMAFGAVYACVTLISSDIAKLRVKLVEQVEDGTWLETTSPSFSPVLRKPNAWQNRIAFYQNWLVSKLSHGNAYILKERDNRSVVSAMYVLNPMRCQPLVTPDGDVYYQLNRDDLAGVTDETVVVPASDIIHDVMCPLWHPLVGVSPLIAAGSAAVHGLTVQGSSQKFFGNNSRPGGILTAPGEISRETAERLKELWEQNYTGTNAGRIAVLGDNLKYESMSVTAVDAQLIEQLKWDGSDVCAAFHVPPHMAGIAVAPTHANVQAMNMGYYTQCLQVLIEAIELCLVEALGLWNVPGRTYGVEFDIDQLLRMDTNTLYSTIATGVGGGFLAPDEARGKIGLGPTPGGKHPYLQQQNFSLEALAKRDAQSDPFAPPGGGPPPAPAGGAPSAAPGSPDPPKLPAPEPDKTPAAGISAAILRDALAQTTQPLLLLEWDTRDNPNHQPAGGPDGGQFAPGGGSGGGGSAALSKPGLRATGVVAADKVAADWKDKAPDTSLDETMAAAKVNQAILAKTGDEVQKETGAMFVNPGVKTRDSTERKLAQKKTAPKNLTDIVRAGFMVESPAQSEKVIGALAKRHPIVDEGWKATDAGYFDRALKVRMPDGQIGEVQIWQPAIYQAKEFGGGHALYEQARVLPPGDPKLPELLKESKAIYSKTLSSLGQEWNALAGSLGK